MQKNSKLNTAKGGKSLFGVGVEGGVGWGTRAASRLFPPSRTEVQKEGRALKEKENLAS